MRSAAVGLLLLLSGCQALGLEKDDPPPPPERRLRVIDETQGSYRGVRFGDSPATMQQRLGKKERAGGNDSVTPLATDLDTEGPTYVGSIYPNRPSRHSFYRYRWAAFSFEDGGLVEITIAEPGAETTRGVAIGDPLARVKEAYPEAVCGTAGGGEYASYPACQDRVAPRRGIWFGGDPISNITLAVAQMGDVAPPPEPFTGQTFELEDGDFVDLPSAKPGDRVVCAIDGKRIEADVPPPDTGITIDPMYVENDEDGNVRAECGGVHAETAPPGSW